MAELLVEVAEGQMERDDRFDALDSLDEAIEILQGYGKEHNDKSALERADEIRELKKSYEET